MPVGDTTTGSLADSLDILLASARQVREFEGVMQQVVDRVTLDENTGLSWREVSMAQLTAQTVTETTHLNNPQMMDDTLLTLTPTMVGIHTFVTDKTAQRISVKAVAKMGGLSQNAIERKKDQDGIVVLDGATTSLSGTGTTLASGVIRAASYRITSNTTENGPDPINCVLHGFQIKDIEDELVAGIGTYNLNEGPSSRAWAEKFRGRVGNANIFEAGNMTLTGTDAKGGVFAQMAIILVQGRSPYQKTREEPDKGGGGLSIWLYDEYVYGERSAGNWLFEIFSDATVPTS